MASPTPNPERRQFPRTTVSRLAYINLDSNNGAIVLNVSAGGLCFHSAAPVPSSETIRFWFSEDSHRIEVDSQLAWMDEKQKTGGLRFSNLSTDARRQILDWTSQRAILTAAGARLAPSPSPSEFPKLNVTHSDNAAHASDSIDVRSPTTKVPALLSGFSAGLVFGILVSTLVAVALLAHAYPREFGTSLIRLGERLRAAQGQTVPPARETASPAPATNPPRVKLSTQPQTRSVKPQQANAVAAVPAPRAPAAVASPTGTAPAISSLPLPSPSPKTAVKPAASDVSTKADTVPKPESADHPSEHIEDSRAGEARSYSAMYLEVGRFHDATGADQTTSKLEQLGLRATVVRKGHFWMNSYQVLVGPYSSDDDAKAAHKYLVSRGFTPRAYERGSRSFWFPPGLTLQGTHIPVDDCVVRWESYVSDAIVKFEKDGSVITTAEGKWVRRDVKYPWNAIVYQRNRDGSRTLLEIRFEGMNRVLVFGESS